MQVLLLKTSSMGDLIHTLPALTDASRAIPGITFDWVVEKGFADIPTWHPTVNRVIPVSIRRWRKNVFSSVTRSEWRAFRQQLKQQRYDLILDAQGLVKSACLALFAEGRRAGLNFKSAREPLASLFYQQKADVNFYQHAVVRMRSLFAQALGYELPQQAPDFGLDREQFAPLEKPEKYIVFLHGTTWVTKQWPQEYWASLASLATQSGYRVKMSGGHRDEAALAAYLIDKGAAVDVIPQLDIPGMAKLLANANGAVAVDTGFGHLAAALGLPIVSIYGPTNPEFTGAIGNASIQLKAEFPCAPCFSRTCHFKGEQDVSPACYVTQKPIKVWQAMLRAMAKS